MSICDSASVFQETIEPYFSRVLAHPLYGKITGLEQLRIFTAHHVYAVWDFMCLLKALQRIATSVDIAWVPRGNPETRRLINEIVVAEECDELPNGRYLSHFELYLEGMKEIGADIEAPKRFIEHIANGHLIQVALREARVPLAVRDFVFSTMDVVHMAPSHVLAAAFAAGREGIIPGMFLQLVTTLDKQFPIPTYLYYLQRHVQIDGEKHGQQSMHMLRNLCNGDSTKWRESAEGAIAALQARAALWDAIATLL